MKKAGLIIMILATGFMIDLSAQNMVTGGIDSVTTGSVMPYAVTPDAAIVADPGMDDSDFDWFFTDLSDNVTTTGMSVAESKNGDGYYDNDSINVSWSAGAGSQFKVKVAEVGVPLFGTGCRGNEVELPIEVVARPTVDFNGGTTSGGGCSITDYDIVLDLSGYGPWDVTFTVDYNQSGSPSTFTETMGTSSDRGTSTLNLTLTTATHLNSGTGRYDVEITNVVDRIAKKSIDQSAVASQATDLPGSAYTIGINPTPTTSPIRHIRNL